MQTFPNQKVVQIRSMPHNGNDKKNPYGCLNVEASNSAARRLKHNAYRLYVRMALNKDGYTFALSPKEMKSEIGISTTGYASAVKELIKEGYLVQKRDGSNNYEFYENPPACKSGVRLPCKAIHDFSKKVEIIPQNGGELPQKKDEHPPRTGRETIQDSTNNINNKANANPTAKHMLSQNKRREQRINNWIAIEEEKEKHRLHSKRNDFWHAYNVSMRKPLEKDTLSSSKYKLIINRYLEDHPEPVWKARIGNKFGRWITGWDSEKNEPIITYAFGLLHPTQMVQNIELIPKEYYLIKK